MRRLLSSVDVWNPTALMLLSQMALLASPNARVAVTTTNINTYFHLISDSEHPRL